MPCVMLHLRKHRLYIALFYRMPSEAAFRLTKAMPWHEVEHLRTCVSDARVGEARVLWPCPLTVSARRG